MFEQSVSELIDGLDYLYGDLDDWGDDEMSRAYRRRMDLERLAEEGIYDEEDWCDE